MTRANIVVRKILPGRGNTAVSTTYTGIVGEITVDTDLDTLRVHDGVTAGGKRLATYAEVQAVATGNIDISGITANVTAAVVANIGQITYSNTNVTAYLSHVTGNIIPQTNVAYSLGDATHQWKSLYVSGQTIYIGGVAVSVGPNGLSSTAGFDLANANATSLLAGNITSNGNVTAGNVYADQFFYSNGTAFVGGANLTPINANIAAANAAISAVTTAWTANAAIQATDINALRANITAANATVLSNYNTLLANAGVAHSEIDGLRANITAANVAWQANAATQAGLISSNYSTLIANAAVAHSEIDGLRANITASNVSIASLQSNAGTQQTQINSINANVAAANAAIAAIQTGSGFATVDQITANISSVTSAWTANATTQATDINALRANVTAANSAITTLAAQAYTNTNTAAYLEGNVTTGNLTVSFDTVVLGNLRVQGTQTTVNAATLTVNDLWVTVANGAAQASDANGAGLRVAGALANIAYSSTSDSFSFNKPISVGKLFTSNITSGTKSWSFGSNGVLSFPPSVFPMGPGPEVVAGIEFTSDGIYKMISDQSDRVMIDVGNTGLSSWGFTTDGNITMPMATTGGTGLVFNWAGSGHEFTRFTAEGNYINPSLVLRTGDANSGERHAWTFDSTGVLTTPGTIRTTTIKNTGSGRVTIDPDGDAFTYIRVDGWDDGGERLVISNQRAAAAGIYFYTQGGERFMMSSGQLIFPDTTAQSTAWTGTVANLTFGANTVALNVDGNLVLPTNWNFHTSPAVSGTGIIFGDGTYQYTAWTGAPGYRLVNGAHTATLDSTGNLTVPGAILPTVDNTQDLGSATNRFRHLYVGPGTVYVGNAAIKTTATGNLILPGLTRAVASSAYAEEVDDRGDQTQTFTTVPTIIDNATYQRLNGGPVSGFTSAEYSVDALDGDGYIDGISIDSPGSGYADAVAELAQENMWATEAADPINNFNANDWIQIPFQVRSRAGESEYEFNTGGGNANTGDITFDGSILQSDTAYNFLSLDDGGGVRLATTGDNALNITANSSGSSKTWEFGVDGVLTIPGSGLATIRNDGEFKLWTDDVGITVYRNGRDGYGVFENEVSVYVNNNQATVTTPTGFEIVQGNLVIPNNKGIYYADGTAYSGGGGGGNIAGLVSSVGNQQANVGTSVYSLTLNSGNNNDDPFITVYKGNDNNSAISIGQNISGAHRANVVAIGNYDVGYDSLPGGVYIGYGAGYNNAEQPQGLHSIAIGSKAAWNFATNNSITLNATGNQLNPDESGLFIKPIREEQYDDLILYYNSTSGEVTYAANPGSNRVYVGASAEGRLGDLWYNTEDGRTYVNISNQGTYTWVDANPSVVPANMVGYEDNGNIILTDGASIVYSNGVSILSGVAGTYGNTQVTAHLAAFDGNITRPASGFTFTSTITGITLAQPVIVTMADNIFGGPVQGTVTISGVTGTTEINGIWGYEAADNNAFMLYPVGNFDTTVDGTSWTPYVSGGSAVADYQVLQLKGDSVKISTHWGTEWMFDPEVGLIFPDGTEQTTAYTGQGGTPDLSNYQGNIYINSESSGLIIDAAGDKRVGFMKYFGMEASFVHANGPTKSIPFQIGRVAADDITRANNSVFTSEVYIAANGKVGINTTGPTEQLTVGGNIKLTGNIINTYGKIEFVANSSGDGYGFSTMRLKPYDAGYEDAYIILDPTYPNHIHIRAGGVQDASSARLFLGGEITNFNIDSGAEPAAFITANNNVWTFNTDGQLAVPGTVYGTASNVTLTADTTDYVFDANGTLKTDRALTVRVPGVPSGVANWSGQGGWNQGYYSSLATTGGTGTGLTVNVAAAGGGYINIGAISIMNPGSGYTDGDVITIVNENNLPGTFTITVPVNDWTFGANAALLTPGSIRMAPGGRFITDGSTGVTAHHWYNYPNGTTNWFIRLYEDEGTIIRSRMGLENLTDLTIETTNFNDGLGEGGPEYKWTFGGTGNLSVPSGGKIGGIESPTGVDLYASLGMDWAQLNYNNTNFMYVDVTGAHMQAGPSAPGQYEIFLSTDGSTTFPDHMPVTITGNLTVGNLFVNGNTTTVNTSSYVVSDNIIQMADGNPADTLDIGFVGHRTVNGILQHTGLVRDASTGIWELFSNVTTQPGTTVDFTQALLDDLQLDKLYADTIHLSGTPPSTNTGASGDLAGDIHIDSNYLYYCTQDWTASQWTVGWGGAAGDQAFLTQGDYPTPQVGWAISQGGYQMDILTVTDTGYGSWQMTISINYGSPTGGTAILINPDPAVIWKSIPLNTFQTAITGTYSNTNVAAYLTSQRITSANIGAYQTYANTQIQTLNANIGAFHTYANATFSTSGGSTYSNANVVSMLGANTTVIIGNVNTWPLQANVKNVFLGANTAIYDGYSSFGDRTMIMNNGYYDVNGALRYRNTGGYGIATMNFNGSVGFLFGGASGASTANVVATTALWATISSAGFSTAGSAPITSGGGVTVGSGQLGTGAATGLIFNTATTTLSVANVASNIFMGASTVNVQVGGSTMLGNVSAGNILLSGNITAGNIVTTGTYGNITGANVISANSVTVTTFVRTQPVTFANLPTASNAGAGARAFITDGNTTTFGAQVSGSGANSVPIFSNGTNWYVG